MPIITGVILAGGKSSRMNFDKGLIKLNGKVLVQYSIETLQAVFEQVVINTNQPEYAQFGLEIWEDTIKDIGPLGGIYTSLQRSHNDYCFVLACDMPFVDSAIVQKIISESNGFDIVIPYTTDGYEPLCALYSKNILPIVQKMISETNYKMQNLIHNVNTKTIDFTDFISSYRKNPFHNINTQKELNQVEVLSTNFTNTTN